MENIYYRRVLSPEAEKKLSKDFAWMINLVREFPQLDFQITFNPQKDKAKGVFKETGVSRLSVYRGTSRPISFAFYPSGKLMIEAASSYRRCIPSNIEYTDTNKQIVFNQSTLSYESVRAYFDNVEAEPYFDSYYRDKRGNKKEGVFQNLLNRRYTLFSKPDDDFIMFDREFEFGFFSGEEENEWNKKARETIETCKKNAKEHQKGVKSPHTLFTKEYEKKQGFDEIDGIGINRNGDILIFEVKHPGNNNGIAYGPMQVRYYIEQLRKALRDKKCKTELYDAIGNIIKQKQNLGILKLPKGWKMPSALSDIIIPYLVIGCKDDMPIELESKKEYLDRFNVIKREFEDKEFPMKVKICAEDGTLMDYSL